MMVLDDFQEDLSTFIPKKYVSSAFDRLDLSALVPLPVVERQFINLIMMNGYHAV